VFTHLLGWYTVNTFSGLLPPNGIVPSAKFTLRPSCAFFYVGGITNLLHGTQAVGVSQTLWGSAEGATCIWQGCHHVEHRPTF